MKIRRHVILIGMPGCGKTSFGRDISKEFGAELYDTDEYIELMQKKTIPDIFQSEGEDSFREHETESLKAVLGKAPGVISTGGGIVKRSENREIMKRSGMVIFIDRPLENIFSDVDTESRPLLAENKDRLYKLYDERHDLYKETADHIVVNDRDYYEVLEEIKALIEQESEGGL